MTVLIALAAALLAGARLVVLTSWPGYCLVAASLIGLWLMESSFNAAPLHASLPAITAAEPIAGIALGVVVFGDVVRVSPGMIALRAAGLAASVAGVIMVARAPALSSLRPAQMKCPSGMPLTTMIGDGPRFEAVLVPVSSVPGQMSLRATVRYGAPFQDRMPWMHQNPAAGRHGP